MVTMYLPTVFERMPNHCDGTDEDVMFFTLFYRLCYTANGPGRRTWL